MFITGLNTVRANAFLMPAIILATFGFVWVYNILSLVRINIQYLLVIGILIVVIPFSTSFAKFFYGPEYEDTMMYLFNYGFEQSLTEAIKEGDKQGIDKIVVTKDIQLPEVYTLYYSNFNMKEFHKNRYPQNKLPDTNVKAYGRFSTYPYLNGIKEGDKYIYVARQGFHICLDYIVLIQVKNWKAEVCNNISPEEKPL